MCSDSAEPEPREITPNDGQAAVGCHAVQRRRILKGGVRMGTSSGPAQTLRSAAFGATGGRVECVGLARNECLRRQDQASD